MQFTETHFRMILGELISENALACHAVLRLLDIVFTTNVLTLMVTFGSKSTLYVNLAFLNQVCETEAHVKAVILHEFLHILLNHTVKFKRVDDALNLALDAVINAMIHRALGETYSSLFSKYYADAKGVARLLRPMMNEEACIRFSHRDGSDFFRTWYSLYSGALVADDMYDLVRTFGEFQLVRLLRDKKLLGNHDPQKGFAPFPAELERLVNELSRTLDPRLLTHGRDPGDGIIETELNVTERDERYTRWEQTAWRILRECLQPDHRSPLRERRGIITCLPLLNERDRRAFLRARWNPLVLAVEWETQIKKRGGTAQIYLDVSGSMTDELQALVSLLYRLRHAIRFPFWAFSNTVAPARIENRILKTRSTGGTSINVALEHIAKTRPTKAVIISDGYVEECDKKLLERARDQKLCAIVSRGGSPSEFARVGIPYAQLEKFPK